MLLIRLFGLYILIGAVIGFVTSLRTSREVYEAMSWTDIFKLIAGQVLLWPVFVVGYIRGIIDAIKER